MWCSTAGFIVTLTLSTLAAPLVGGAQPVGKVPMIGFLTHNAATQTTQAFEAFAQGLRELGYIEGQTMTIERRYARADSSACQRSSPTSPPATSMSLW
jgi:putative ABC transport system substrate-binding protein